MVKLICHCCGNYTIESIEEVIVDICDVCYWQYDIVAHNNPDLIIGPNKVSLKAAKENYKQFRACNTEFKNLVREPFEDELPENN